MESRGSSKLLAPGFRFHPTDEELVGYYLRRKVYGKPLRFDAISHIDIYKVEPWDLPGLSRLNTRDLEWYFFSMLDKKYGNGSRTNRATEQGYWKTTGKDRAIHHKSQVVGMKKTLVYHSGRAPKGQRTNWVMHEYKLVDEELDKAGISQDAFVLCRVFQKSGAGPKNGEKYGAPFVEEEWEDDELQMVPKPETTNEVEYGDIYLDGYELEQILGTETPVDSVPTHMNCSDGKSGTYCEEANDCSEDAQKCLQQQNELKPFDPAVQHPANNPLEHEYIGESGKRLNSGFVDYLLNGPLDDDSSDALHFNDGAFLEANDLSNPVEVDNSGYDMFEEYLTYFDANDDFQNMGFDGFDPSVLIGNDWHVSDQASPLEKNIGEVAQQVTAPIEQLAEHKNTIASSSMEKPTKFATADDQYRFMKQASEMLGSIPAPPAFASEFPSKDAARHLNSMPHSANSVRVTAGVIQIRNNWSLGKHGYYNIILSFGLCQGSDSSANPESVANSSPGKATSTVSRGWFSYLFFWVLILSMSFKIGTLICAR